MEYYLFVKINDIITKVFNDLLGFKLYELYVLN